MEATNAIRAELAQPGRLGSHDAAVYSQAWTEAFIEAQNADGPRARRALRAERRAHVRVMRIRVELWSRSKGDGEHETDWVEVYGWRAALAAARAMRAETPTSDGPIGYLRHHGKRHRIVTYDARLIDAIDAYA